MRYGSFLCGRRSRGTPREATLLGMNLPLVNWEAEEGQSDADFEQFYSLAVLVVQNELRDGFTWDFVPHKKGPTSWSSLKQQKRINCHNLTLTSSSSQLFQDDNDGNDGNDGNDDDAATTAVA